MDCREFEEIVEELVAERAPVSPAAEARQHQASCDACRELEVLVRASLETPEDEADDRLTGRVIATTTGATCDGALLRLVDLSDERGIEADLVHLHLDHCGSCRRVAETLDWMTEALPSLAEIRPDDAFMRDVLAA